MEAVAAVAVDAAAAKTTARHNSSVVVGLRASLPHITEVAGFGPSSGDDDEGEGDGLLPSQRVPKLSLEEMSEERLMEQFGSISRCAIKSCAASWPSRTHVHRSLRSPSAHSTRSRRGRSCVSCVVCSLKSRRLF